MQRVQVARHPKRPYSLDYLRTIFSDFVELHGDRLFRDDPALVAGWARLDGQTVMVIGHQKGRDTKENLRRNFGMAHPEGYRKALRLMHLAEQYRAPVITLVDTPGAYPGLGAEERGQAEAIARNLVEMATLRTPILTAVIGEGGSGGALAVGLADRVLMLENSVLRHLPRGLRRHPLEGREPAGARRRGAQDHRRGPAGARGDRRDHRRAAGRGARRPRGGRRGAGRNAATLRAAPAQGQDRETP